LGSTGQRWRIELTWLGGDVAYSYTFDDPAKNQKRALAFFLVLIIHVLFVWVLASGLGKQIVEFVAPPVETEIVDEKPEEEEPPPPPPPDYAPPPPFVPPPDLMIAAPVQAGPTTAITTTSERPTVAPPPKPAPSTSVKTPPSTQGRGARITQPEYPPASRRAGEEGTVNLQVYVLETGRAGEIKIAKPSGFPKLDEAAVKEVQRNWRFVPGKEDGKPVAMWHIFAVTFRLTD
jgi:protein TonB